MTGSYGKFGLHGLPSSSLVETCGRQPNLFLPVVRRKVPPLKKTVYKRIFKRNTTSLPPFLSRLPLCRSISQTVRLCSTPCPIVLSIHRLFENPARFQPHFVLGASGTEVKRQIAHFSFAGLQVFFVLPNGLYVSSHSVLNPSYRQTQRAYVCKWIPGTFSLFGPARSSKRQSTNSIDCQNLRIELGIIVVRGTSISPSVRC
jgi:hypothetical protein